VSPRLRDYPDDLTALIQQTAQARGIPVSHVEKDFWVIEVLRIASAPREIRMPDGSAQTVTFTFKGGTSLSRVFQIIDRFSEDVDLLAHFPPGASPQARHSVLRAVDDSVSWHLGLAREDVTVRSSTTGVKRYTGYPYRAHVSDDTLKDGVILELGSRGGRSPSSRHSLRSLVADYAVTVLGDTPAAWEEFASFDVTVLAPERTLLEKLAAVHDAASRNDTGWLLRSGRHFYDIYHLLHDSRVTDALASLGERGVASLVDDIDAESLAGKFTGTPRPAGGYADSPAFDESHESFGAIGAGIDASRALIYGEAVTIQEVVQIVGANRPLL
jgi:hypothetical protein